METANQLQSVLSMIGALVIFILILVLAYFATKYIGRRYGTTGASGGRLLLARIGRCLLSGRGERFFCLAQQRIMLS